MLDKATVLASIKTSIKESYDELVHKVTWPTWPELQSTSVMVLVASIIIAIIIFLMDYIFGVRVINATEPGFHWKGILGYLYEVLKSL